LIAANLRQSLALIYQVHFKLYSVKAHRSLAGITALVGAGCQLHDSFVYPKRNNIFELHVLFGLALVSAIIARFLWEVRRSHLSLAVDIHVFNRQLHRQVYLLLYALAGVKELANIGVYWWRGGEFVMGGVHIGRHMGNDAIVLPPFDDFEIYAVYAVASIFLIRALLSIYGPNLTLRR